MNYSKISFALFLFFLAFSATAQTQLIVGTEPTADCNDQFSWSCQFPGSPSQLTSFALPDSTGQAVLQSWTVTADPFFGLDGVYAYVFRLSLTGVTPTGPTPCISSLEVPFGRVLEPYDGVYPASFDAFMLTNSFGGSVQLTGAEVDDNVLRLTFPDVCADDMTRIFGATSTCSDQIARVGARDEAVASTRCLRASPPAPAMATCGRCRAAPRRTIATS